MRRWRRGGYDPNQFKITWGGSDSSPASSATEPLPARNDGLSLTLPWDFRGSFPEPTEQAIEAGVVQLEEMAPDNIRAIHEEHAREMLAALRELDVVLDAKRRGIDPATGNAPRTVATRERLQKRLDTEPARLERWFENLLAVYEDAFGPQASESFGKAVRAWHAGIEVHGRVNPSPNASISTPHEVPPPMPAGSGQAKNPKRTRHARGYFPVPRPLSAAVDDGRFGKEDDGKPVRPSPAEVRAITENHAEKLIDLLDALRSGPASDKGRVQAEYDDGVAAYAEDFGTPATEQLQSYCVRQLAQRHSSPGRRDR